MLRSMLSPEQRQTLKSAKRLPLALLLLVALGFVASSVAASHWQQVPLWLACIKAVTEASLVGALADWFAVSALFRHIPLPLVGRHTAIIPRNKDRIGLNLANFVRDKFLDGPSLVALIERHDPARVLAGWLTAPANSALLGRQVARLALAALEMVQDRQVERFLSHSFKALLAQLDLPRAAADLLSGLTRDGRHQAVLDDVLARVSGLLREAETHVLIAQTIVLWLKREHPLKEKMLPTDWLGEKGATAIAGALDSLLQDIASDPGHHMRKAFDDSVHRLVARLQSDPAMADRAERLRDYLLHDEKLAGYLRALWLGLRARLQADLANDIADTVRRWDALELSELIELHIGKDLQYIRINGTLVGGAVGLLLFLLSNAGRLWA
jgi:uncharacterized membrane-anchored protein YjiN (DUF445 family)